MIKQQIRINNKAVGFYSAGEGATVVFLHGFMESSEIWEDYLNALSDSFRVIAIDLPGHGSSESYSDAHTMFGMASRIRKLLLQLKTEKFFLIGHSMGGYVALEFAEKSPEMLSGLCMFHSNANADSPEAKENRDRAINVVKKNRADFITLFIPDLFAPGNRKKHAGIIKTLQQRANNMESEAITAAMEGMKIRRSHYETLKNISVPVLYIVGQLDTRIDMEKIMEQVLLPADCTALFLRDCGHMGYVEARDECLRAIRGLVMS